MALHRGLLRCYNERDILITEFLERLKPLEGLEGEEREKMQDRLALEIEAEYPYRAGKEPKRENYPEALQKYPVRNVAAVFGKDKKV